MCTKDISKKIRIKSIIHIEIAISVKIILQLYRTVVGVRILTARKLLHCLSS